MAEQKLNSAFIVRSAAACYGGGSLNTAPKTFPTPPLGTSGNMRRRILLHHLPFAIIGALVIALFTSVSQFDLRRQPRVDLKSGPLPKFESAAMTMEISRKQSHRESTRQTTVATGYVAVGFLVLTMVVGPANLLLRRQNPVSSHLRRDLGIWTGIYSGVHVLFGFHVNGGGRLSHILRYFVDPSGRPLVNSFGWGNWTGLVAWLIAIVLLVTSNDAALRRLKSDRWKGIQRLTYAFFVLVIAHAFFYGVGLRVESPFTVLLGLSILAVVMGQATGLWIRLRK
jgi:methionine sulfoxide reductase heme-binding subunit